MIKYVQFVDESRTQIQGEFGNSQDREVYPNQGEVEDDDPRYLEFINPPAPPSPDPIDKLREFLAANPDVAAILS
ncbi:hypothetical protein PS712_05983 [Pseudomonas fluorescens]|uniref:Uncharacterized protein n=1 Tax=Pseudomonas fluorescens TaxID=294 RepID=A0A5E7FS83_PSEFL|nr:hypothetical protein PS712_05983 [Pseudomonas fluorescens]